MVLDKTGTLSYGSAEVLEIRPAAGVSEENLLVAAAIAESRSEHPVAKAILKKARGNSNYALARSGTIRLPSRAKAWSPCSDGKEIVVGNRLFLKERGIDVSGMDSRSFEGSEIGVARGRTVPGSDPHRRYACARRPGSAISALKSLGLKTILLTGDARNVAESAAKILGVDEVGAEMLPAQKVARVRELMQEGRTVVMVGDGINDAPALMQASVGVAMGSGTDVARESANVVLIGNDLSKFVDTIRIARQCRRIILQNFTGTLIVDAVGIVLAASRLAQPAAGRFYPRHL